MKHWSLIAGAAMLTALPAAPVAAETAGASRDDEVVCKVQRKQNSRLAAKKDCRTRKEWAEVKERSRNATDGVQRQSLQNGCIYSGAGAQCGG